MLFLELNDHMLNLIPVNLLLILKPFKKAVVDESALLLCPEQSFFLNLCGIETKAVGGEHLFLSISPHAQGVILLNLCFGEKVESAAKSIERIRKTMDLFWKCEVMVKEIQKS